MRPSEITPVTPVQRQMPFKFRKLFKHTYVGEADAVGHDSRRCDRVQLNLANGSRDETTAPGAPHRRTAHAAWAHPRDL